MLINLILEGLELHLEGIWGALGWSWASSWRSWTALGCFLDVQNPIFFQTVAQDGFQEGFWIDFGSIWERIGEDFWSTWEGLGKIFLYFGCLWEGLSKRLLKWFGVDFRKSTEKRWSDLGLTSNRWQGAGGVSAKRSQLTQTNGASPSLFLTQGALRSLQVHYLALFHIGWFSLSGLCNEYVLQVDIQ